MIEIHPLLIGLVIGLLIVALFLLEIGQREQPNYPEEFYEHPDQTSYVAGYYAGRKDAETAPAERLAFGWDDPIKQYNTLEKENGNNQK